MMTRKRYGKQLIVMGIGNVILIFIMSCLFGEPWSSVPPRLMGLVTAGIFFWWTWRNWPTNIDDDEE